MQALMLAAGMGKRLGKYTQDGTKCMVQVNGKTLIEHAIEALIAAHIKKLILVVGYRAIVLQKFLKNKFPQIEIIYVENPIYDKTNNIYSLFLATEYLVQDDTVLLESDLIFDKTILTELLQAPEKNLAVVSKFESWMDGTVTLINEHNNIVGLIDKSKFNWAHIESYYKTVNIYKFSKEFSANFYVPFLEAYQKAFGQNEYYEQVLKVLAFLDCTSLNAFAIQGERWYEIDDPQDLAIAENRFSTGNRKLTLTQNRYGGYWRFPQLIDYCYLVNPYFPPQQLVNELTSNFLPLLTQYPSGLREQSILAGKIFSLAPEQIIVGNGAAELISALGSFISGTVAIPYPTFNEYPERFVNAHCVEIPINVQNFSYTTQHIIDAIRTKKDTDQPITAVLLINPDNPSGNFLEKQKVLELLKLLQKDKITLIFDESFIDFAEPDKRYTLLNQEILDAYPNLIVIKSISKSYGVPGLRLGVLATANSGLLQKMRKEVAIWNINSFAEYFLQIFDKYKKTYIASCEKIAAERSRFIQELQQFSTLTVFPSQANYVLCRLNQAQSGITSSQLAERLLENDNIFIKDLSSKKGFENGQYLRLAVRSEKDNTYLISVLKKYLNIK